MRSASGVGRIVRKVSNGLVEYRYGALAVVQKVHERDSINAMLRAIDPRLFLEKQRVPSGEDVWCVVENIGGDQPPVTVYEHRDPHNVPIPVPTEQIVENFRRRAQENLTWRDRLDIADRRNAEIRSMRRAELLDAASDIQARMRRLSKTSVILPRRKTAAGVAAREQIRRDMERHMGMR